LLAASSCAALENAYAHIGVAKHSRRCAPARHKTLGIASPGSAFWHRGAQHKRGKRAAASSAAWRILARRQKAAQAKANEILKQWQYQRHQYRKRKSIMAASAWRRNCGEENINENSSAGWRRKYHGISRRRKRQPNRKKISYREASPSAAPGTAITKICLAGGLARHAK